MKVSGSPRRIQSDFPAECDKQDLFQHGSKMLYDLSRNNYIDRSAQKEGILGVPRCMEHKGVVKQLIWEAHKNKRDLKYHG